MEPNYWLSHMLLGLAYEQQGDLNRALAELEKATAVETE
jgi:Flp pilus assembly protein TadD